MYTYVGCTAKSDLKINDSFLSSFQEVNFVLQTPHTHASEYVMYMYQLPHDTI